MFDSEIPLKPDIDDPENGYAGISYEYGFILIDIDSDYLWYYINRGDVTYDTWIGSYSLRVTKSYTWNKAVSYKITVKARDSIGFISFKGMLYLTISS